MLLRNLKIEYTCSQILYLGIPIPQIGLDDSERSNRSGVCAQNSWTQPEFCHIGEFFKHFPLFFTEPAFRSHQQGKFFRLPRNQLGNRVFMIAVLITKNDVIILRQVAHHLC